jgi:hypothetical protein
MKFKHVGTPTIYKQFLEELEQFGIGITGSYNLLEFPNAADSFNSKEAGRHETLRVLAKILAIRGLPRFIIQLTFRKEHKYDNLYLKSRIYILWTLLINHRKILRTIQSIKISRFTIGDGPKRSITAPFYPWDKKKLETWLQKSYHLIPNQSMFKLVDLKIEVKNDRNSILKEINRNSPKRFWKILNELDPTKIDGTNLQKNAPIFSDFISSYKKLKCTYDANAHLTLDEVFATSRPIQKISDAEIWHAIHVVKDGNWIMKDITEHPKQKFVAGHSHFSLKTTKEVTLAIPKGKMVKIESGFLLTKRCDENWYHFLIDLLPQVMLLRNLPPNTEIIVRDDLPDTAKSILEFLELNTKYISLNSKISVKNLYYIPHRSSIFDSPVRAGNFPRVLFAEQTILKLRKRLKSYNFKNKKSVGHSKVFVVRVGKYRNSQNLVDLEQVLKEEGFKKFAADKKYLRDQFTIFRNAERVLLSGGAMTANMIFMKEHASMVVLGSWRSASLGLWSKLGNILGVKVIEVKGIPTSFSLNYSRRLHSDYFIPKVVLKYYLKR